MIENENLDKVLLEKFIDTLASINIIFERIKTQHMLDQLLSISKFAGVDQMLLDTGNKLAEEFHKLEKEMNEVNQDFDYEHKITVLDALTRAERVKERAIVLIRKIEKFEINLRQSNYPDLS
jgi:hypothetical protein